MCGRYYYDVENDIELRKLLQEADRRLEEKVENGHLKERIGTGEIRPTERAVIIRQAGCHSYASAAYWGYPFQKKQILLARLETVLEKPMFSESMLYRRCVIPAAGFYEWSHDSVKKKYYFTTQNAAHFYMAGLWKTFEDGDHFVIVTTEADERMRSIHDRQPVVFNWKEAVRWLADWQSGWQTASLAAPVLDKRCCEEYEQLTLF